MWVPGPKAAYSPSQTLSKPVQGGRAEGCRLRVPSLPPGASQKIEFLDADYPCVCFT